MAFIVENALKLTAAHYSVIGEIVARFALLEYQLREIAWNAMGLDNKQGRTMLTGMNTKALVSLMRTITKPTGWAKTKRDIHEINFVANRVHGHAMRRNSIAHGVWTYRQGGDSKELLLMYVYESEERLLPRVRKHDPVDLLQWADELASLNVRAEKIARAFEAKNPAQQRKSGEQARSRRKRRTQIPREQSALPLAFEG